MEENGYERVRDAITRSSELSKAGEKQKALELLDNVLTEAIRGSQGDWIRMLSRHAAIIADSAGDVRRVRYYYEQSLAYVPDDPFALYGLAEALSREGQVDVAKQHAAKSYELSTERGTALDLALVEVIVKRWPELDKGDENS